MNSSYDKLMETFERMNTNHVKTLASKLNPESEQELEQANQLLMTKVIGIVTSGKTAWAKTMVSAAGVVWESFWTSIEKMLPVIFYQMSRIKLLADIEYQAGMSELTPTMLDTGTLQRYINMYPDKMGDIREDFKKSGYTDERIDKVLKAGKIPLKEEQIRLLLYYGYINNSEAQAHLKRTGVEIDKVDDVIKSWEASLPYEILKHLHLRGHINQNDFNTGLQRLGFRDKDVNHLNEIIWERPGISDLVRMAVREVFTPELAGKYGLFEDYPEEFTKYAQESGLAPEWSKRYWAAHWELPSIQMGFEMMHRGVIDNQDLYDLLRAKDVMPYWRDKLTDISYNPLTRVDVRRMYAIGVLDRDMVVKSYMDIGYTPENAELMAQFTELEYGSDDRGLTKTEILSAYEAGLESREAVIEHLDAYGYTIEDAELIVDIYDYKRNVKLMQKSVTGILTKFEYGYLSEGEAKGALSGLGLDSATVAMHIEASIIKVSSKVKTLDLDTTIKAFSGGVIPIDDFRVRLQKMGYNDIDINILIELNKVKK